MKKCFQSLVAIAFYLLISEVGKGQAQVAITNGPTWDATQTSIRVMASTDIAVRPRLRWGKGNTNKTLEFPLPGPTTIHGVTLSGLEPGKDYSIQFCGVNPSNQSETCSDAFQATTLNIPLSERDPATLPNPVAIPLTPPARTGLQHIVGSDCLSPVSGLQYWLNNATFGDEIILPRSTKNCWGRFTYSKSSNSTTDYIILRSDAETGELPPAGSPIIETKVDLENSLVTRRKNWDNQMSTIWHAAPNYIYGGRKTPGSPCGYPGAIVGNFGDEFEIYKCSLSQTARNITDATTGSPVIVTAAEHGYNSGDTVVLNDVNGITVINDIWTVNVLDANRFNLQVIQGAYSNTTQSYAGGGKARRFEWAAITRTTGTGAPVGSCSVGQWYQDQTASGFWWTNSLWRCIEGIGWVRWLVENQNGNVGMFDIQAGASNLYVYGIRFKALPIPEEPEWSMSPVLGFSGQTGSFYQSMIRSNSTVKRVVFDRVIVDGSMEENVRSGIGIYADGSEIAVINSAVMGMGHWQRSYTLGKKNYLTNNNITSAAILISCGPGPGHFENNYLEAYGLTFYIDDTCPSSAIDPPSNYTVRRNLMHRDERFYEGSATWQQNPELLKRRWNVRQIIEQKNGSQILYEGNRLVGGWADGTGTSCAIVFTPYNSSGGIVSNVHNGVAVLNSDQRTAAQGLRTGDIIWFYQASPALNGWKKVTDTSLMPNGFGVDVSGTNLGGGYYGKLNTKQTTRDISIGHNTITSMSCGIQAWGASYFTNPQPMTAGRFLIEHNFFYKLDGMKTSPGSAFASPETGTSSFDYRFDGGIEGVVIRHNTSVGRIPTRSYGTLTGGLLIMDWYNTQGGSRSTGLVFRDNISSYGTFGIRREPDLFGKAALDKEFVDYKWAGNVVERSEGADASFPPGTQWVNSLAQLSFLDLNSANFRLRASSPFQSGGAKRASDGEAVGANIDEMESKQGLIRNIRVNAISLTTATVAFQAPDLGACSVDWSTMASFENASRVQAMQTAEQDPRSRHALLENLPSGQRVDFRIFCGAEIVSGFFSTLEQ